MIAIPPATVTLEELQRLQRTVRRPLPHGDCACVVILRFEEHAALLALIEEARARLEER